MGQKTKQKKHRPEQVEEAPSPKAAAPLAPEPEAAPEAVEETAAALENFEEEAGDEGTMQGLLQEAEAQSAKLSSKEVSTVKVVSVVGAQVLVNVGERLEGVVPVSDFPEGQLPNPGDEIPVVLVKRGSSDRNAQLSYKKAREEVGWKKLGESFVGKHRVSGTIAKAVKGGFLVDVDGVSAFLPLSLADRRPLQKGVNLVGKNSPFVIIEMDPGARRLVVSRKQVLEEDLQHQKKRRIASLRPGQVLEGKVVALNPGGATVDLGGMEGQVALADLSWRPLAHPKDAVKTGQKLKLKVLHLDPEQLRISLGLRQLQENPADALRRKYKVGMKVKAKVLAVSDKGVSVEVTPEIKGFVPARDFEERGRRGEPPPPPRPMTQKPGETVGAVVEGVNPKTFELMLSLRKFDQIEERETVKKYMRGGPRLTLGDLLRPEAQEESEG